MYIIVISFIVSLLFLLPTLYQVLSVNKPVKAKEDLTELDFLYQYREILQKIMLIENELKAMVTTMDYYHTQRFMLFSPIETVHIKQDIESKVKWLMERLQTGECSLAEAEIELEDVFKRLDVLDFKASA
jgi:hypothetical protein